MHREILDIIHIICKVNISILVDILEKYICIHDIKHIRYMQQYSMRLIR